MKRLYIILLIISVCHISRGQNLVDNWSFEDSVACPSYFFQMYQCNGWSAYRLTPDYFNSCNFYPVGVPLNGAGFQAAKSGSAYAGFFTYRGGLGYQEILGSQLIQPLIVGQKYFVKFFVSMAYKEFAFGIHINTATNKLGIQFSMVSYSDSNYVPITNSAQIYSDSVIADTINWIPISGSFIADSAYNYIMAGCFFVDSVLTIVPLDTLPPFYPNAYYYIDDICVSTDSLYCETLSGINQVEQLAANIFPNPFDDELNIHLKVNDQAEVFLYDLTGRMLLRHQFISSISLNTSMLPAGMYVYQLRIQEGMKLFGKLVKS